MCNNWNGKIYSRCLTAIITLNKDVNRKTLIYAQISTSNKKKPPEKQMKEMNVQLRWTSDTDLNQCIT